MTTSRLQKYILKKGLESRDYKISKKILIDYYKNHKNPAKKKDQISIITKSVERLIKRGLIRGFGVKTAEKWFILQVGLTRLGIKKARELFGQQQTLPLRKDKKNKSKS